MAIIEHGFMAIFAIGGLFALIFLCVGISKINDAIAIYNGNIKTTKNPEIVEATKQKRVEEGIYWCIPAILYGAVLFSVFCWNVWGVVTGRIH